MQSERLSIRTLSKEHEPLYCDLFMDPVTMRHIGAPLTLDGAKRQFRGALAISRRDPPEGLLFSVCEKSRNHHIGICSLLNIDRTRSRAEVGVMLRPARQGQGFGAEALRIVLALAYQTLSIDEVWGQFHPSHVAVERMNIRAGMADYGACADYGALPGMRVQRAIRSLAGQIGKERAGTVT